jgi:hypothetical protein
VTARWRKGRFKPGYQWRILAHRRDVPTQVELSSESYVAPVEFDELVIDHWFHIEQMSDRHWWFRIGNYSGGVTIDGYGKPAVHFIEEETPDETAMHCERRRLKP